MSKIKRIISKYRIPKNKRVQTTYEHKMDLLNRNIIVNPIGLYMGLEVPMIYEYPCGHRKEMRPSTMKGSNKGRCLDCFPNNPPKTHQYTTKEFEEQLKTILPNIEICGNYTRSDEPIDVKCSICGYEWGPIAHTLKQGHGCPKCKYVNRRITQEEFDSRIQSWHYEFDVLDKYSGLMDSYTCRCRICGYCWKAEGRNLVSGRSGCSNCFTNSNGERIIRKLLEYYKISYIPQKKYKDLRGVGRRPLMYDFYIDQANLLIEYQGIQHEKSIDRFGGEEYFKLLQEHDRRKREYANLNGINFLEIWYYDYGRIEEILKNCLNLETRETDVVI